jgi:hypothetical protein
MSPNNAAEKVISYLEKNGYLRAWLSLNGVFLFCIKKLLFQVARKSLFTMHLVPSKAHKAMLYLWLHFIGGSKVDGSVRNELLLTGNMV